MSTAVAHIEETFETAMRYGGYNAEFRRRVAEKRKAALAAEYAAQQERQQTRKAEIERRRQAAGSNKAKKVASQRSMPKWACDIVLDVAAKHEVPPFELLSKSRAKDIIRARNEAFYRVKEAKPVLSLPRIGQWFVRDHTTIAHGLASHADRTGEKPLTGYDLARVRRKNASRAAASRREVR